MAEPLDPTLRLDSIAVHAGREDLPGLGVHAPPIDLSTTNPLQSIELGGASYESLAHGGRPVEGGGNLYGRFWNPTVDRFEQGLATLEHAEAAVAVSSGMAAVTTAIMAHTTEGRRHVLAVRPLYGGTDTLLASGLLGVEAEFCTQDEIGDRVRPDTALVVVETPANPTLDLVDIAHVVAQAGDVPVMVDNTFATPVLQNPLDLGAAMSMHSATKYLGGHGDVLAGAIACNEETATRLRSVRAITGNLLHPLAAYLLHRGLATLPLRMRAQQENARTIAARLREHPGVERVYYPDPDDDPRGLIGTQMRGTGAMMSIALAGGYPAAERFTGALRLFLHAVSLGGVDSLVQHPAAITHRTVADDAKPSANIVRLSIGLEDVNDLLTDLDRALPTP